ncbi:MAG TPA: phosphatidylglycerophosphatase A [Vicinamibacterales bacterium]|nr:phosphatidylglycerophosphatase A [Vicinamibacterales bacterium]
MKRLAIAIATTAGLGYAPIAPGTFGSAAGVAIHLLFDHWTLPAQIGLAAAVTLVGIWASAVAAIHFGRSDPSHVVIDEVAGQLVTYLGTGAGWKGALAGFLLFRGLDILKPWPANRLEALHGGVGIVADDIMAGLYGCAMLHALIWLVPAMR